MTPETIKALAEALGTDDAAAAKWLRRGPDYYSIKARPTTRPWKPFRGRVVNAEVHDAGWRVVTADDLRDTETFYRKGGESNERLSSTSVL